MSLSMLQLMRAPNGLSTENLRLATEAKSQLGYKRLLNHITPAPFLQKLIDLEILPFKTSSVYKYMASKEGQSWAKETVSGLWCLLGCAFSTVCAVLFIVYLNRPNVHFSDIAFTFCVISVVCLFLAAVTFVSYAGIWFSSDTLTRRRTYWNHTRIEHYLGAIPLHVLNKALQIRGVAPTCDMFIHQLESRLEEEIIPQKDPFLEVKLGDESYFVEVWDEKDYEEGL